MKTNFIVSNSYNSELFAQNLSATDTTKTIRTKSDKPNIPVPAQVEIKTRQGEDPRELHRRYLMEASSEAGLDGTNQQKEFVERWMKSGIKFSTKESDPSPENGLSVRSEDIKGEWRPYELSADEIKDLKRLQKEYVAQGGTLTRGRTYENTSDGEAFSMSRRGATGKKPLTDAQYEQRKLRDLWKQAQIPETSLIGTPAKLRDLKNVNVKLSDATDLSNEDRALLGLIGKQYGGGNIWGDKQREILSLAKAKGVRIENMKIEGDNASFDISVENLLKTHIAYINVQEQVNDAEKITNEVRDKMALNQFLIGVGEGAWGAVKANYNMIRHPIETYNQIKEAIGFLKNLSQEDLMKIYESLKAEGHKFIFEKDISEVSRDVGKVVGAAAVEFILGKGLGAGLKALRGLKSFPTIIEGVNKAKQAFNKVPIPVPGVKVAVDTMGNKIFLPDLEVKKLEDLIKPLESRATQTLSGAKKAINLPSWSKLTFKLENDGKTIHFLHNHTVNGKGYQASMKAGGRKDVFPANMTDRQIFKAVREAYENSKKVGTQDDLITGDKIVELVGYSNDGMKIRMYVNVTRKQLDTAFPQ